jgi:diacylglycerol O-acyltransferase
MERLSPLDALFLDAEDEDRHASLAIASIAVAEGPAPSQDDFLAAVRGRLALIPRYRQKVRQLPLDLGQPVWVDDPTFDLAFHVRRTAVPAPGDDAALFRLAARIMSQRLDRDRPLWECWVVEGLADDRWAVLTKVHHCVVDGVGGNGLYRMVFDSTAQPGEPVADAPEPTPEPSTARLTMDAIADLVRWPLDQARLVFGAFGAPSTFGLLGQTISGLARLASVLVPVSPSPLVGPIGQQRRYSAVRVALPDVVRAAKAFQVTVNDLLMAAVTGALRAQLLRAGTDADRAAVRALVPVSVRKKGDEYVTENRISVLLPLLPVEYADPVNRLVAVHQRLGALKAGNEAEAGTALTALAKHEPFAPISLAIRIAARLPHRNLVTLATNVPGPRQPLYVLGRPILEILPYAPIAIRMRTGIAALTYHDQMVIGVTCDYGTGPDPDELARDIGDGIAQLIAAAPEPAGPDATTKQPRAKQSRKRRQPAVAKGATATADRARAPKRHRERSSP